MAKEREHAEAILRMARKDFDALRGMTASDRPELFSDEIFGFHAQQAVEKALKSWIALIGHEYPKTHDLMSLIDVLADAGEDVQGLDDLTELNPFAVQFRYEAFDEEDVPIERPVLLAEIERLLHHVGHSSPRRRRRTCQPSYPITSHVRTARSLPTALRLSRKSDDPCLFIPCFTKRHSPSPPFLAVFTSSLGMCWTRFLRCVK